MSYTQPKLVTEPLRTAQALVKAAKLYDVLPDEANERLLYFAASMAAMEWRNP